jgi:hypothetical protein
MSVNASQQIPELDEYDRNRGQLTQEQLAPYVGQWVAFSKDGKQIVAAASDLLELDRRIVAAGEDPENVYLECITDGSSFYGAL